MHNSVLCEQTVFTESQLKLCYFFAASVLIVNYHEWHIRIGT